MPGFIVFPQTKSFLYLAIWAGHSLRWNSYCLELPVRTRTHNLLICNQPLYPIELRKQERLPCGSPAKGEPEWQNTGSHNPYLRGYTEVKVLDRDLVHDEAAETTAFRIVPRRDRTVAVSVLLVVPCTKGGVQNTAGCIEVSLLDTTGSR